MLVMLVGRKGGGGVCEGSSVLFGGGEGGERIAPETRDEKREIPKGMTRHITLTGLN